MLVSLTVEHLALIEKMELSFQEGMTVITGETGAGKSILLSAIALVLGGRASSDWVAKDSPEAYVEAVFHLDPSHRDWTGILEEWDIPIEDELILTRRLFHNGRSVCRCNGRNITVSALREIGSQLVLQNSQHEQQALMEAQHQLTLLTRFAHLEEDLTRLKNAFNRWKEVRDKRLELSQKSLERLSRLDLLQFQMQEIDAVSPISGEEESLFEERMKLQSLDKLKSLSEEVDSLLKGKEGYSTGVLTDLAKAVQRLENGLRMDGQLQETLDFLQTALIHVEEAGHALDAYQNSLEFQPNRLADVEDRLIQLRGLMRKYGTSIDEIWAYRNRIEEEVKQLENFDENLASLEREEEQAWHDLKIEADLLSNKRKQAADKLASEVTVILKELDMPSAQFIVNIRKKEIVGADGQDEVSILFSANSGEDLKPLVKVASGGELSRVLLALQTVFAEVEPAELLIFDEIDTGVSGYAVDKMARQLQELARHKQVICVTHSPQIAASSGQHLLIEKRQFENRTISVASILSIEGRIQELGRLLGSSLADNTAQEHAKALLQSYDKV